MKKTFPRSITGILFVCILSLGLLCSCTDNSQNKPEEPDPYEYLKTDIVGMWMEEGGPYQADSFVFGPGYDFYEFTSEGHMYFHHLYKNEQGGIVDGITSPGDYHFEKNALIYDEVEQPTPEQFKEGAEGSDAEAVTEASETTQETTTTPEGQKAGVYVDINGNLMTMESSSGVTRYVRLSLEETTAYLLHYQDEGYKAKQEEYSQKLEEEELERERAAKAAEESAAAETAEETAAEASEETEAETSAETEANNAEETAAETEADNDEDTAEEPAA